MLRRKKGSAFHAERAFAARQVQAYSLGEITDLARKAEGEKSETDKDDSTTEDQARRLHDRTPSNQRAHRMFKLMGMQPIDRLFRMPHEVFGGLNSHGEYRPAMYLHAKAKVLDIILF